MTTPPLTVGPYEVCTSAIAVLQARLPDYLTAFSAARGQMLPVPAQYFAHDLMARVMQSPCIGVEIVGAPVVAMGAMGSNDIAHDLRVVVYLRLSDMPPDDADTEQDLSYFSLACRTYCDAAAKCLEAWMPMPEYRADSYVYRVDLGEGVSQPFVEDRANTDTAMVHSVSLICYQRVQARIPYQEP